MELGDYVRVVRRRWRLILSCLLLAIAAATLLTVQATPQFASTARLFVSTSQAGTDSAYQGGLFSQQRVTSYADLITGKSLAQRVVDELGLPETAEELSEKITSSVAPETVILELTVTDPNARRAQQIASTAASEFSELVAELETPPGRQRPLVKVSLVDEPGIRDSPVSPRPARNLALGTVLGLLVGVGIAVLRDLLDTSVKSGNQLADITGTSMLASVRYDPRATKAPLVSSLDNLAPRAEEFRVLRTNMQYLDIDQHDRGKTFIVTSSTPGEGKSTTVANIAITVAQAGQRVVLVEGDLRRPKLAEYLRLETAVGLTTVLIGRLDLEAALQTWGPSSMPVLTSGAIPPNPAELLQSHAMADLLATLRQRYDLVLVDAPPLLPVTDAALLTAQADGAILVVRHGKTSRDDVEQSLQRVTAVGGRLLGTVLNMAPEKGADGYGHRYGYAPGQRLTDSASTSAIRVTAVSRSSAAAAWRATDRP